MKKEKDFLRRREAAIFLSLTYKIIFTSAWFGGENTIKGILQSSSLSKSASSRSIMSTVQGSAFVPSKLLVSATS